jgi:hypothetical protein
MVGLWRVVVRLGWLGFWARPSKPNCHFAGSLPPPFLRLPARAELLCDTRLEVTTSELDTGTSRHVSWPGSPGKDIAGFEAPASDSDNVSCVFARGGPRRPGAKETGGMTRRRMRVGSPETKGRNGMGRRRGRIISRSNYPTPRSPSTRGWLAERATGASCCAACACEACRTAVGSIGRVGQGGRPRARWLPQRDVLPTNAKDKADLALASRLFATMLTAMALARLRGKRE